METWFVKSMLATISIVPSFLAIPFFQSKLGVDPLVFLVWYFAATALSIASLLWLTGRGAELWPAASAAAAAAAIGLIFGALANGLLFQAVAAESNPGLPPVVYATSSVIVFGLSVFLAGALSPGWRPSGESAAKIDVGSRISLPVPPRPASA